MNTKRNNKTIRRGWIIRAIDAWGETFYRYDCFNSTWNVGRQHDEFNDLLHRLQVFAKKEIAESKIPQTLMRLEELSKTDGLTYRPRLPIRAEVVPYMLSIG